MYVIIEVCILIKRLDFVDHISLQFRRPRFIVQVLPNYHFFSFVLLLETVLYD